MIDFIQVATQLAGDDIEVKLIDSHEDYIIINFCKNGLHASARLSRYECVNNPDAIESVFRDRAEKAIKVLKDQCPST